MKDSNIWAIASIFYAALHVYEFFTDGARADYWATLILAIMMIGFSRVYHHLGD